MPPATPCTPHPIFHCPLNFIMFRIFFLFLFWDETAAVFSSSSVNSNNSHHHRINRNGTEGAAGSALGMPFPMSGSERAAHFNDCTSILKNRKHDVDVVYSGSVRGASRFHPGNDGYGFAFMDNVKAGSSTVRNHLRHHLGQSWICNNRTTCGPFDKKHMIRERRTRVSDLTEQELDAVFTFSFVRDPVAKFESGVRQAHVQRKSTVKGLSADEMLYSILRKANVSRSTKFGSYFLNEHLQPSTYRLGAWSKGQQ